MADLDEFFLKKDKKKKKSSKSAQPTPSNPVSTSEPTTAPEEPDPIVSAPVNDAATPSEGWVDLEDRKTAQVNTGGRSVVKMNKDEVTDKDGNLKANESQVESSFKGWSAKPVVSPVPISESTTPAKAKVYRPPTLVEQTEEEKFPSLAEAAKLPKGSTTGGKAPGGVAGRGMAAAPQRGNVPTTNQFEGLKSMLEQVNLENSSK
mmetsp:Transcript_9148/g.16460  ORF Transcript_9148/g.16460 Transcript_9148/m.16460 type:complete len:205 (-) Transcript_9148:387-1001(-)|eukprot:CAMPEP_0182441646 /NCGR_PEP_ID=MMETSP1172-20130603/642_1 /TAXON_ID=708627 /ORGANISM="Timspurckia oligopyrenoides, Strain CCMP3278" /LENGTH=204 /DNA_ID=CAMNT_0024636085 /DNA_START=69 /DNA_END=683 /DNA_ORIENTATION=-